MEEGAKVPEEREKDEVGRDGVGERKRQRGMIVANLRKRKRERERTTEKGEERVGRINFQTAK